MREVICIICPKGCHLKIEENPAATGASSAADAASRYTVSGATCERGIEYGINEVTNPVRVLTSTVKVEGSDLIRCPVRTDGSVPKGKIFECMDQINGVTLHAPVKVGDVVIDNIAGTGVALIATRDIN